MRIHDSARKHGISDADMLHASHTRVRKIREEDGGRTLFIGLGTGGELLEIVVQEWDDDTEPVIIHAMRLRRNYYRYYL